MTDTTTASGDKPLAGKTAVVTGAAGGIGSATAKELARQGASKIVVTDLDSNALASLVGELRDLGAEALFVGGDLTDPEIHKTFLSIAGEVDIYVANAGIMGPGGVPLEETTGVGLLKSLEVNCLGVFLGLSGVLSQWNSIGRKPGRRFLLTGSDSGERGDPPHFGYAVSKAAGMAAVRSAAPALEELGATVNIVCPVAGTAVFTEGSGGADLGDLTEHPALDPANIARFYALLCSNQMETVSRRTFSVIGRRIRLFRGVNTVSILPPVADPAAVADKIRGWGTQDETLTEFLQEVVPDLMVEAMGDF